MGNRIADNEGMGCDYREIGFRKRGVYPVQPAGAVDGVLRGPEEVGVRVLLGFPEVETVQNTLPIGRDFGFARGGVFWEVDKIEVPSQEGDVSEGKVKEEL